MSKITDKIDAELSACGRWARSQYPEGYGNSPCDKWDKPSFGTAFIDQSSDTIQVPFEYRHIHHVIEKEIRDKHRRIIKAVYVLWLDDDLPPAIKRQMRAKAAGCSIGAFERIKRETIITVAMALGASEQ